LDKFDHADFGGIVLDESSILKAYDGKTRKQITDFAKGIEYRLCCTATPAPNDLIELCNHAEFLDIMSGKEILALFFRQDGNTTHNWRLKGHARESFWQWMAEWSVAIRRPSDVGYKDDGYVLPPLVMHEEAVVNDRHDGWLFAVEDKTLAERRASRRDTLEKRVARAAQLCNESDEQWLVWCDLNDESHKLHELINESVEVQGSDKDTHKTSSMLNFATGDIKCLVTKPKIAGFGMNWQNCHNMIFTGLSDSYEAYYQALRRCWRFGQTKEVNIYIIISAKEGCVKQNIERKQADFLKMQKEMTELTKEITKKELKKTCRLSTPYEPKISMILPKWDEFRRVV
jgi:hypothetical protein